MTTQSEERALRSRPSTQRASNGPTPRAKLQAPPLQPIGKDSDVTRRFAGSARCAEHCGDRDLLAQAVVRAKQGDMSALHFLYVRFADDVCGYVRSIVRDSHAAEDITQNVFGKLMTAIHKYEPREVPFAAWILRVARNSALDHLRARRQIPFEEVRTDDEGDEQVGFERSQCLRDALWLLPYEQREVLVLRHLAGLSPREIARRLGKTEGSIHGLHHRGRAALQKALCELEAGPATAA
jgi:RNA polymerase sigma-70 factor (ECF subfamily)